MPQADTSSASSSAALAAGKRMEARARGRLGNTTSTLEYSCFLSPSPSWNTSAERISGFAAASYRLKMHRGCARPRCHLRFHGFRCALIRGARSWRCFALCLRLRNPPCPPFSKGGFMAHSILLPVLDTPPFEKGGRGGDFSGLPHPPRLIQPRTPLLRPVRDDVLPFRHRDLLALDRRRVAATRTNGGIDALRARAIQRLDLTSQRDVLRFGSGCIAGRCDGGFDRQHIARRAVPAARD